MKLISRLISLTLALVLLNCSGISTENAAAIGGCINSEEPIPCLRALEFLKVVESLHCEDTEDNDGDGSSDCEDPECKDDALCKKAPEPTVPKPPTPPPPPTTTTPPSTTTRPTPNRTFSAEDCDNNKDDDGDGREDCADYDCDDEEVGDDDQVCEYLIEDTCDDQFDNDNNGDEDCEDSQCEDETVCDDNDDDGYTGAAGDCNDSNAAIHPGATELCNGLDDDCDDTIDDGVSTAYFLDSDGDDYGDASSSQNACTKPDGYVTDDSDCDDTDTDIHLGTTEVCGNGADDDCNDSIDEGC